MTKSAALFVIALLGATGCQLSYTGGAKPVAPSQLGSEWYRAASTPVVRQHQQTDCGLAALAMVAGAWGHQWSVEDLNQQLPVTDRGVKLGALRDLARTRGLEAFAIKATPRDLERELAQGRPVLLGLLLPFERKRATSHYEVAIAIRPSDGTVVTIDPASGQWRQRTKQVLESEWKPAGYAALVVVGTERPAVSQR